MPLVRIAIPNRRSPEYRKAISQGVHRALVETFEVPENDLFQIITDGGPETEIVHASSYLGLEYSDGLTIIQLTVSNTRTVEQKKRLFARIAAHLIESPGLRPEDVFINLVEVKKENWSFGNGQAQYA
jgi:4-oxalocrotonate tautomerase